MSPPDGSCHRPLMHCSSFPNQSSSPRSICRMESTRIINESMRPQLQPSASCWPGQLGDFGHELGDSLPLPTHDLPSRIVRTCRCPHVRPPNDNYLYPGITICYYMPLSPMGCHGGMKQISPCLMSLPCLPVCSPGARGCSRNVFIVEASVS